MDHGAILEEGYSMRKLQEPLLAPAQEEHDNGTSQVFTTITNYIQGGAEPLQPSSRRLWSIHRVARKMQEANQDAYNPKLVSVGPFHRKERHLEHMEEHKLRFLERLLLNSTNTQNAAPAESEILDEQRSQNSVIEVEASEKSCLNVETLAAAMKELEPKARECYSETFDEIDSNSFVLMMILDGCFVLELLRLYAKFDKERVEEPIITTSGMVPNMQHDFLILENQLPFCVLQKLYELTTTGNEASLVELALKFFDPIMPRDAKMLDKLGLDGKHEHLLGLYRSSFLPSLNKKQPHSTITITLIQETQLTSVISPEEARTVPFQGMHLIHSVTELKEAGIQFKNRLDHDLLDIEFNDSVLEIPPLFLDHQTVPIFLNFVAYEQCDQHVEPYFTHYFSFFDGLVNSHKDVELLHYNGILNNAMGSDEDVLDLFHKLCNEAVYDVENSFLHKQLEDVNSYFNTNRHSWWWPKWMQDNFKSPWLFFSQLIAVMLLFLVLIQFFFPYLLYVHPRS